VFRLAAALRQTGVEPGDRVVQLSENRPEWIVVDLAILFAGGVHVPIHSTLAGPQVVEQIRDCGTRIVLVSTAAQAEKLACDPALRDALKIWSYEPVCYAIPDRSVRLLGDLTTDVTDDEAEAVHRGFASVWPDDLATLIYTRARPASRKA
jgi:long-chain acyl-CoA synthetase